MKLLNADERQQMLKSLPNEWAIIAGATLDLTRKFENFQESMLFVNAVAGVVTKLDHHPTIKVSYNKVDLSLTTHSVGGLTVKDFNLAKAISEIETN